MGQNISSTLSVCFAEKRNYKKYEDSDVVNGNDFFTTNYLFDSHLDSDVESIEDPFPEDDVQTFDQCLRLLLSKLEKKETISRGAFDVIVYEIAPNQEMRERIFDDIITKTDEEENGVLDCFEIICIIREEIDKILARNTIQEKTDQHDEIEEQQKQVSHSDSGSMEIQHNSLLTDYEEKKKWETHRTIWEEEKVDCKTLTENLLHDIYNVTISDLELTKLLDSLDVEEDTGRIDFDELTLLIKNHFSTEQWVEMP